MHIANALMYDACMEHARGARAVGRSVLARAKHVAHVAGQPRLKRRIQHMENAMAFGRATYDLRNRRIPDWVPIMPDTFGAKMRRFIYRLVRPWRWVA